MANEECKVHGEAISEIKTDIKWLVSDSKRRNGLFESHIADSETFRRQVSVNTNWRKDASVILIAVFGIIFGAIGWMAIQHFK